MSSIDIPEEARQKYIERRKTDLQNCRKALSQKDFETLAHVGHQIKGNAVTFGYEVLGGIAIDLESYALKKDLKNLDLVMDRFDKFMSKTP